MFNLFKKKVVVVQDSQPVVTINEDTVSIEEKIHEDVYSAQELLLASARDILNRSLSFDQEKYDRLKSLIELGFGNAKEVAEVRELEEKKKESDELHKQITYYQQEYPFNKFIDEESVKKICKKYGLLLARVSDYIDDIPDKNQKEIVAFKVREKDVRYPSEVLRSSIFSIMLLDGQPRGDEKVKGEYLLVIAPAHKLNTEDKIIDGHTLKIKDPIVLQPVEKGYLIVSSWGLEAGDELVVNAKFN